MKKNLLVIGLVAGFILMTGYTSAENLFVRGDLNEQHWSILLQEYALWEPNSEDYPSHTGPWSVRMQADLGQSVIHPYAGITQDDYALLISPGDGFELSLWARGENFSGNIVMELIYKWETPTTPRYHFSPVWSVAGPSTFGWTQFKTVVTTPPYTYVSYPDGRLNYVNWCRVSPPASGTLWVDDFSMRRLLPPVADAGTDIVIDSLLDLHEEVVTLDGSGSSDLDGTIVSYEWKDGADVIGTTAVVEASIPIGATKTYTLIVTDNDGLKDDDSVTVYSSIVGAIQDLIRSLPRGLLKTDTSR